MSVAAVSWALRDAPIPASAGRGGNSAHLSFVLVVLAEHADEFGRCAWPSVATIASLTRMAEKSVRRCLHRLEELGLIVRGTADLSHVRPDRRPAVWNLNMSAVTTSPRDHSSAVTTSPRDHSSAVTTSPRDPHDLPQGPSRPPPGGAEPSFNREINHARTTSTRRVEPSGPTPAPPQYVPADRSNAVPPERAHDYVSAIRDELNRKKRARRGA